MRWFQDYWLCRLCTLHLPTNIQNQISEQFYLHLSIHFRPILHRQMCPLTDRQEIRYVLHVSWTPQFCSQNGVPITKTFTLNTVKSATWTQDSFNTVCHFCPPLPPYAKWQGFKRAFYGNAAFDFAAATGQIPVSSPQSAVLSPQLLVLWW